MLNTKFSRISNLLAIAALSTMTGADADGVGTRTFTPEEIEAAQRLDNSVRQLETQEAVSIFAQSRALRELRDTEAFKLIQSNDGSNFLSWGQYVAERTSKSAPTVSQNISVVTTFDRFSDEELAKAGREKLYVVSSMIGENNVFPTAEEAVKSAQVKSRVQLLEMRNQGKTDKIQTVYLLPVKVLMGQQDRAGAGYDKFRRIYAEVNGKEGTEMAVADFYNDVVSGLPLDFLRTAAQGAGGAAPEMEGGWTPLDVPVEEVVAYLAHNLMEAGRDPQEVLDGLSIAMDDLRDRAALEADERKRLAKEEEKDAKTKARNDAKWMGKLSRVKQYQTVDFADGAKVSIVETQTNADTGEFTGVWIKGLQDGSENVFAEESTLYAADRLVSFGIVGINPAPKAEKVKAAKAEAAPKEKKAKAAPVEESPIGISKAQQAGGKGKGGKRKPNAIDEGTVAPE